VVRSWWDWTAPLSAPRAAPNAKATGASRARCALSSAGEEEEAFRLAGQIPEVELSQRIVVDRPVRALLQAAEDAQLIVARPARARGAGRRRARIDEPGVLHRSSCPVAVISPDAAAVDTLRFRPAGLAMGAQGIPRREADRRTRSPARLDDLRRPVRHAGLLRRAAP
jgi:hypothetical protein